MKLLDWLKSLFVSKAIQVKTEDAVEEIMDKLTTGPEHEVRRLSEGFGLGGTRGDVTVKRF